MTGRRSLTLAVSACVVGGLLVLLSAGRIWSHGMVAVPGGRTSLRLSVTGRQVAPGLAPLAIAALALAAAVVGGRGWVRRTVGLIVVVVGATVIGVAVAAHGDVSSALENHERAVRGIPVHAAANGLWVLAVAGGLVITVAGALIALRGQAWSSLGERYDAPVASATPRKAAPADAWAALDRGEDPTT